jgi:hypothetical protein
MKKPAAQDVFDELVSDSLRSRLINHYIKASLLRKTAMIA